MRDEVAVRQASVTDREELEILLDRYLAELSQYRENAAGATSAAEYPYFELYWSNADRFPFAIRVNETVVGFALIRRLKENSVVVFQVAEFFVFPGCRRRGIGSMAIASIWKQLPGSWELQVIRGNDSAFRFWRDCVSRHAKTWTVEPILATDGRRHFFHFEIPKAE